MNVVMIIMINNQNLSEAYCATIIYTKIVNGLFLYFKNMGQSQNMKQSQSILQTQLSDFYKNNNIYAIKVPQLPEFKKPSFISFEAAQHQDNSQDSFFPFDQQQIPEPTLFKKISNHMYIEQILQSDMSSEILPDPTFLFSQYSGYNQNSETIREDQTYTYIEAISLIKRISEAMQNQDIIEEADIGEENDLSSLENRRTIKQLSF
ncbi:hypothetical protein pb186bvf_007092 [Paramecium bursaria]